MSKSNLAENFQVLDSQIGEMLADVMDTVTGWDCYGVYGSNTERDGLPERIEHESRSGFIPFTNGGFNAMAYVSFNHARDQWSSLQKYWDSDYKDMCETFFTQDKDAETPDDCEKAFSDLLDAEETQEDSKAGIWTDNLPAHKWRQEWQYEGDDSVFFLVARAIYYAPDNHRNETGEPEVYFFAGVNTDFNYGRDSIAWAGGSCFKDSLEYGATFKMSEITPELLASVKTAILKTFQDA